MFADVLVNRTKAGRVPGLSPFLTLSRRVWSLRWIKLRQIQSSAARPGSISLLPKNNSSVELFLPNLFTRRDSHHRPLARLTARHRRDGSALTAATEPRAQMMRCHLNKYSDYRKAAATI
jgi:hypothetical protein